MQGHVATRLEHRLGTDLASRPIDVLAIGSALREQVIRLDGWPVSGQQANIRIEQLSESCGGCAVNVSAYAARLGARTVAVAAIGTGRYGAPVLAELEASGVETRWMKRVKADGGLLMILSGPGGNWTTLDHTDPAIVLTAGDLPSGEVFATAKIIHIDGYSYVTAGNEEMAENAVAKARAAGCLLSVDSSMPAASGRSAFLTQLFAQADIAFANATEAALVTGHDDPGHAARALLALGPVAAIVKCGAEGSVVATAGGTERFAAVPVAVADTISAGDAYVATTLAALCRGEDLARAALEGSHAGALACRAPGSLSSRFTLTDLSDSITRIMT